MKKYIALVLAVLMALTCLALVACGECEHVYNKKGECTKCGEKNPNYKPECTHNYSEGVCTICGENDPNYVAHTHNFVEGTCSCGATDPNYVAPENPGTGDQPGTGDEPQQPSVGEIDATIADASLKFKNTGKIYLTSIGQANFSTLKMLFKNVLKMTEGTDYIADNALEASQVTGNDILFICVGGSTKGLGGSTGFTLAGEVARAQAFGQVAGLEIVVVHIGGADYRGTTSDPLIEAAVPTANVTMIVDGANADNKFTTLAKPGSLFVYSAAAKFVPSFKFLLGM